MNAMAKALVVGGLMAMAPAIAHAGGAQPAAQRGFITDAHAKRLIKAEVKKQPWGKQFNYKVELSGGIRGIGYKSWTAKVNWGKGPHIMIAVPEYSGSIDTNKQAWSPRGGERVRFNNAPWQTRRGR